MRMDSSWRYLRLPQEEGYLVLRRPCKDQQLSATGGHLLTFALGLNMHGTLLRRHRRQDGPWSTLHFICKDSSETRFSGVARDDVISLHSPKARSQNLHYLESSTLYYSNGKLISITDLSPPLGHGWRDSSPHALAALGGAVN